MIRTGLLILLFFSLAACSETTDSSDSAGSGTDTTTAADNTDGGDAQDATDSSEPSVVVIAQGDEASLPASTAGDYCSDGSFGSATTAIPTAPDSAYAFTTALLECG